MNQSQFLNFCNRYGISPCYANKTEEALLRKIRGSDFLIADDKCTHRMIGFFYRSGSKYDPKITLVCTRSEMALAKKIAFENGKKIFYDSVASATLFRNYREGEMIYPKDFRLIVNYYINFLYNKNQQKK